MDLQAGERGKYPLPLSEMPEWLYSEFGLYRQKA